MNPDQEPPEVQAGDQRLRVHGRPTYLEVAALTTAFLAEPEPKQRPQSPAWLRAGLREGLGGRPAAEPSDLR